MEHTQNAPELEKLPLGPDDFSPATASEKESLVIMLSLIHI